MNSVEHDVPLARFTTLRLGGPARRFVHAHTEAGLIAAIRAADSRGEPVLVLGGGSNLVVADMGFEGLVVRVETRGVEQTETDGAVVCEVQAGEAWDEFVSACVRDGLAGVECLSGIPGSVGATPMQNVGAYGQEVGDTVVAVRAYDRKSQSIMCLPAADCMFSYRSSRFKREPHRWVVLSVTYQLLRQPLSQPIHYGELALELGLESRDAALLAEVRQATIRLRRRKGMVLDPNEPDSVSAGSFFTNPILSLREFENLEDRVRARCGADGRPPGFRQSDGSLKTSAAWLVEHSGFSRGYGDPDGIAISSRHTLALTNRGGGTTSELMQVAREIRDGVEQTFGVRLVPEPVFAGLSWDV